MMNTKIKIASTAIGASFAFACLTPTSNAESADQDPQPNEMATEEQVDTFLALIAGNRLVLDTGQSRLTLDTSYTPGADTFDGVQRSAAAAASISYGLPAQTEVSMAVSSGLYSETSWDGETDVTSTGNAISLSVRKAFKTSAANEMEYAVGLGLTQYEGNLVYAATASAAVSMDPIILNASIEIEHDDGSEISSLQATTGVIFAVNRKIALGSSIFWRTALGDGFRSEPERVAMTFDVSLVRGRVAVTPNIQIGLDDGYSPNVQFGLGVSRAF